jgi:DNA-directed RNA polymerase subunit alpha
MAILTFQKPDKIVLQKVTDFEAQFEFRPLEPGYGVTIGNSLRRVLLNSLEGYAIIGLIKRNQSRINKLLELWH